MPKTMVTGDAVSKAPRQAPAKWRVYIWIFDKGAKNMQHVKGSFFSQWCWGNWPSTCRSMKPDPYLTPCTKINSTWIKLLSARPETVKLLEESIGEKLLDIGLGNSILGMTTKAKICKWDCPKLKNLCTGKEAMNSEKSTCGMEDKYLQAICLLRG